MKLNHPSGGNLLSRITVLVLCGLYLLFSVGVNKATHFCMGKEASVAYFTAETKKCACSLFAQEEQDHCCDDTQELIKLVDSQKTLSAFQLHFPTLILLGELYHKMPDIRSDSPVHFSADKGEAGPPPKILYKVHCSFVFYDKINLA